MISPRWLLSVGGGIADACFFVRELLFLPACLPACKLVLFCFLHCWSRLREAVGVAAAGSGSGVGVVVVAVVIVVVFVVEGLTIR